MAPLSSPAAPSARSSRTGVSTAFAADVGGDAAVLALTPEALALRVSEASHIRRAAVLEGERPNGGSEVRVWVHRKGNKPREFPLRGVVLTAYLRWLYLRKEVTAPPRHEDYLFICCRGDRPPRDAWSISRYGVRPSGPRAPPRAPAPTRRRAPRA